MVERDTERLTDEERQKQIEVKGEYKKNPNQNDIKGKRKRNFMSNVVLKRNINSIKKIFTFTERYETDLCPVFTPLVPGQQKLTTIVMRSADP